MAKKVVTLTIKLKDGFSSVFTKLRTGLKDIARGFAKLKTGLKAIARRFAPLAKIATATSAAIVGGAIAVGKAWADQESVNRRMKATFDAAGESGTLAVAKWGAFATEIQRVTTLGDEAVMGMITLGKAMRIPNDKLAEVTTGAIGLSKAFAIDLNTAMKMSALAFQGEYTLLQRYIPELRSVTDETKKAAIVQQTMARGFKVAKGELDTIAGQWTALKGVVGDAFQEIGRVLFGGDDGLIRGIEMLKEKIIEMTEDGTITRWAQSAKSAFDTVVDTIRIITSAGSESRTKVVAALTNLIKSAFIEGASKAVQILAKAIPVIGATLGDAIKKAAFRVRQDGLTAEQSEAVRRATAESREAGVDFMERARLQKEIIEGYKEQNRQLRLQKEGADLASIVANGQQTTAEALAKFVEVIDAEAAKLEESVDKAKKASDATANEERGFAEDTGGGMLSIPKSEPKPQSGFIETAKRLETAFAGQSVVRRVDVGDAVRSIAGWERRGQLSGVEGLGAEAEKAITSGSGLGVKLNMRMRELLDIQRAGETAAGGDDRALNDTNSILREQLKVLEDRLGGVTT